MIILIFAALAALLPLVLVLVIRLSDAAQWRRSLIAYQVQVPTNLRPDEVAAWLGTIHATTHPSRFSLFTLPPVCWEVVSTAGGISFYVVITRATEAQLLASLRGSLPGVRITAVPDYLARRPTFRTAAEATTTNSHRPLATDRVEAASAAFLASLQPIVGDNTEVRMQWIFVSAGTPPPVRTTTATTDNAPGWVFENTVPQDAEAVQAARLKQRAPLFLGVVRIGITAANRRQERTLFGRVWNHLHRLNAPGVRIRRRFLPSFIVGPRLSMRRYPLLRWPVTFNATEGSGLLGFPVSGIPLPGMALGSARQLPPALRMPTHGQVIALSNYPGMTDRPLALTAEDRTRHSYIVGPAGSGKSVLLTRLILSDIASGYGVFACDPKGDLVQGVLERLDDQAAERVVVLDASKRDHPVGLNILAHTGTEESRELAVDNVLHVFREIWSAYWGPRTDQVLRAALTALVHVRAVDGSAMTICEVVPLLTNPAFRHYVVSQPDLPPQLRTYWQRFSRLSENEMAQHISPVLNKVEAFTQRVPIRLMLGQSDGLDLADIFRHRAVVLVNLAKGELGTETGNLLGALIVAELWKATLGRVKVPLEQRRPCFAYIDEAQDIVRLPLPIADMLAQSRGFKLGVTLANQYLAQLPEAVRAAVLGTVRTQIAFAVEYDDAKLLERRFAPLTVEDLSGLPAFELAMRPCVGAQTLAPVTGTSMSLPEPINDSEAVATASRALKGTTRAAVEEQLHRRVHTTGTESPSIGRRNRGATT